MKRKVKKPPWKYTNPKDGTEMVLIPGGWFRMGSEDGDKEALDRENPRHLYYLKPYYLGIYCVTVGQFRRFSAATKYNADSDWQKDPDEHPVRYVNWHDAKKYAKWADSRLPTEAEWELGAGGRIENYRYPWGNDWESGRRVCRDAQEGPDGSTVPVSAHPEGVSPFGTYQQSGNVWEWCEDWFDDSAYQRYAKGDFSPPKNNERGRVLRGGSWCNRNLPGHFRGARRRYDVPERRFGNYGFRLARTVTI